MDKLETSILQLFLDNKYTRVYQLIIKQALIRSLSDVISERHHIIPKSLGGSNCSSNLVNLTPKEHYICHLLLPKMTVDKTHRQKMLYAMWCMINGNGNSKRHSCSARRYQIAKEELSHIRREFMKANNPTRLPEVRAKLGITGENNPAKRLEVRAKMRGPRTFVTNTAKNGVPDTVRKKISDTLTGRKDSDEARLNKKRSKENLVWVHNNAPKSCLQVHTSLLENYLNRGYSRGRGPKEFW